MKKEELFIYINNLVDVSKIKDIDYSISLISEKYYSDRQMFSPAQESYKRLARLIIEDDFPSQAKWNRIAIKEGYFLSSSLQYIFGKSWREIGNSIAKEIKELLKEEPNA